MKASEHSGGAYYVPGIVLSNIYCIHSFHSYNNPNRKILLSILILQMRKCKQSWVSKVSKVTHELVGKPGFGINVTVRPQSLSSYNP